MLTITRKRVPRNAETGFSLAELMVVICIMGVLMVGAIFAYSNILINAKEASAMSALRSEYATFTTLAHKENAQSAEIEAFGIENIGNIGAYKQVENFFKESGNSSMQLDYSTFLRVSDLSGELDLVITYEGNTRMFEQSEDGIVTASYKKMQIEKNR